jgi:hypothetical protein
MATSADPNHSTIGSGAAGRATEGETDETLAAERESEWAPPGGTAPEDATTPPDMQRRSEAEEMPDPDGSRHRI